VSVDLFEVEITARGHVRGIGIAARTLYSTALRGTITLPIVAVLIVLGHRLGRAQPQEVT